MGLPEHVATIIDNYKQIGFSVAIDDFGAGHSGWTASFASPPTRSSWT